MPLGLHAHRLVGDRAAHVVEHVVELVRFAEGAAAAHGNLAVRLGLGGTHGKRCGGVFAVRDAVGCVRVQLRGGFLAAQPIRVDVQFAGQEFEHVLAGHGLAGHILADVALAIFTPRCSAACTKSTCFNPLLFIALRRRSANTDTLISLCLQPGVQFIF